MKYFIGIDNGGTATKAAVFDAHGQELGSVGVSTAMLTPKPGFVERDMEEMWQANCTVIRGVLEKTGIAPADIAGVGVCGHGKGLYLWGQNGRPLGNGIISTDNRAYEYPLRWRADGTEASAFALSCQHVMACQPVALLAWLRDNEPERYREIRWVFACKDYIRFRLTGKAGAELTDYSGDNLVNLHTGKYDPKLLELFGLDDMLDKLPPLCNALDICGRVSRDASEACGLPEGTPVLGGMFDIDACALAVGMINEENLCMIAGTWSINGYLRKAPVLDGSVLMNSLFCLPEYYLVEESSPTSAGNSEWFLRQLLPELTQRSGPGIYETVNAWVESIPPQEFVPVFLPFLMASNVHPNAKGGFIGINVSHTRRHLLRAVYEGIAFSHRYHLEKLQSSMTVQPSCIRLAGGAARSAVWTQIFADTMKLPVARVSANETGALGCAIAVAAATGYYDSLAEAVSQMCTLSRPVEPDPALAAVYDDKYALYLRCIQALDAVWKPMQRLSEGRTIC